MSFTPVPNEINFDSEITGCTMTKPHEAIKSDFTKKLINHVLWNNKFKEPYIKHIIQKLEDESESLTPEEGNNFLEFLNEHKVLFDGIIKKYKGQFPARVQSEVSLDSMNMKQEEHVLYKNGEYISLDKVKNYVKSRIEWPWKIDKSDEPQMWISETLWKKIEKFAVYHEHTLHGSRLKLLWKINYKEKINHHWVTIHNINEIAFVSMETEKTPLRTFTLEDLNNDPEDYTKGRSIGNLKNNPEYINLVETSNAKTFESIEQSNAFHFKLMQEVADQLWFNVIIDLDFVDNPSNDRMTNLILSGLYSLTRKNMIIPYKIDDENGLVSSIDCNENSQSVYRDDEYESSPFSLFLEVNPTEKNN